MTAMAGKLSFLLPLLLAAWFGIAPARAEEGDLRAGVYAFGRGDYPAALKEFRPLAEAGDAEAQVRLGVMLYMGLGTPPDHAAGAAWFGKAAEQGHAKAQYLLGNAYFEGKGVPQDYGQAAAWYRKAAGQGLVEAQSILGTLYGRGLGVGQDLVKAHAYLSVAAARGDETAARNRDIVAKTMPPEDIAKARRLAEACAVKDYEGCGF